MDYEFTCKLCMKYCFKVSNYKMFRRCGSLKFYMADKFDKVTVRL
jgi:hypothetical protein